MRRWLVPMLLPAAFAMLAGCSRNSNPSAASPPPDPWQAAAVSQSAAAQPMSAPDQAAAAQPAVAQPSPYGSDAPLGGTSAAPPAAQAPAPALPADAGAPPPPPAAPNIQSADRTMPTVPTMPAALAIPAGAPLEVRVDENLNTRRNHAGDGFDATLANAVVVSGQTVLPAGTRFHGHVTRSQPSGRLKGHAVLVLTLDGFRIEGRRYRIRTNQVERESGGHRKRDEVSIGGGAGFGAAMGGIAGGGVGAAIGAAAGAGAGTVGAAITGKKEIGVRAESLMRFRLETPVAL